MKHEVFTFGCRLNATPLFCIFGIFDHTLRRAVRGNDSAFVGNSKFFKG